MYSVSRLFPAAELEALRGSIEGFTDEPPKKRRRTTEPSLSKSTSARYPRIVNPTTKKASIGSSDSGYGSARSDSGSPNAATSPQSTSDTQHLRSNSLPSSQCSTTSLHKRSNTVTTFSPPTTQVNQTSLFNRYLLSLQPSDRAAYLTPQRPASTLPSRLFPVAVATPTPPLEPTDKDYGWTAGPRLAATAATATRVFDGVRLTGDERAWLDSLLPGCATSDIGCPSITPIGDDEAIDHQEPPGGEKNYDGFAVSHGWEEDEGEEECGYEWAEETKDLGDGEVADFFKIEEACVEGRQVDGEIE